MKTTRLCRIRTHNLTLSAQCSSAFILLLHILCISCIFKGELLAKNCVDCRFFILFPSVSFSFSDFFALCAGVNRWKNHTDAIIVSAGANEAKMEFFHLFPKVCRVRSTRILYTGSLADNFKFHASKSNFSMASQKKEKWQKTNHIIITRNYSCLLWTTGTAQPSSQYTVSSILLCNIVSSALFCTTNTQILTHRQNTKVISLY